MTQPNSPLDLNFTNDTTSHKPLPLDTKTLLPSSPLSTDPYIPDTPGLQAQDVYDSTLPWWRAAVRSKMAKSVEWESGVIADMQHLVRTPWLDSYFVYTSSLGTHTFFMTFLPLCFFFGYDQLGRGLIVVLSLGVYLSSFVKDLFCSPRPFAPPVTRLTMGNHHLEYGFPSTHSTNSISIALFFYTHVHRLAITSNNQITTLASTSDWTISPMTYWVSSVLLAWYAFSIVFGRLYTAMHSFTDCIMGCVMGAVVWAGYWMMENQIERWLETPGWTVPLTIIPLALLMVNQHPVPVDDCPCFEDAIAFVSVLMGCLLARWGAVQTGFDESFFLSSMPGSQVAGWTDRGVWWSVTSLKMIFGIVIIFTWRILAKSTLHLILPPTFRLLAQAFTLPNRRFYTPATDYKNVPSELGLRPIPSVIDLPEHLRMEQQMDVGKRSSALGNGMGDAEVRIRGVKTNGDGTGNGNGARDPKGWGTVYGTGNGDRDWELEKHGSEKEQDSELKYGAVKHYDADVLTKVFVYSGIAILACSFVPVLFEVVGWGVKSW